MLQYCRPLRTTSPVASAVVSPVQSSPWRLTAAIASLFLKPLRPFMPMVPCYVRPIAYDGSRLQQPLGEQSVTRCRDGIGATLDWLGATT